MVEDNPFLSVDNDWKKQAQEEKRKLAEEQAKKKAEAAAPPPVPSDLSPAAKLAGGKGKAEPGGSFETLVQTLLTQTLYYLGELAQMGGEGNVNLDRAKHQVDVLTMLEEKTANNLTEHEKQRLDIALYESRTRFISVASQYL